MRRDTPSAFEAKTISADTTLTTHDVLLKGLFVSTASGVTITLPPPQEAVNGAECLVVNHSSGDLSLSCADGFPNDADNVTVPAGDSVMLYCANVSGHEYRWALIGDYS
jgi:hypothetical protein